MIGSKEALADFIRAGDDFMVVTHIRPDGDAYGSALALVAAMRALGKRAFAACDDPVDPKYRFLPGTQEFCTLDSMPFAPACALSADVSSSVRMGRLLAAFETAPMRATLDHHKGNDIAAKVYFIDDTRAAAGELVLDVIDELGVPFTKDLALNLFVAISTDTGNFNYNNTSGDSMRSAARCVDAGVDVDGVTRRLYRMRTHAQTKLLALALDSLKTFLDGRVAGVKISNDMFERAGAARADAQNIVNYANEIDGADIGFSAEEIEDGVKLSFRSGNRVNILPLAKMFGGGGHMYAAGATLVGVSLADAFSRAAEAAVALLKSPCGA